MLRDGHSRGGLTVVKENGEEKGLVEAQAINLDDSDLESEISKLRGQWELACVLNFLNVFEPVIGNDLKRSAEEIEMSLIKPNDSLARLHIALLKGIPPVSKNLNGSDAWVTVLSKKLAIWWPWVAEGDIPLTAANGVEISRYKELDPTIRLLILKSLCEIRADQDDAVSYINDALKSGTQISFFRKDNIGGDGKGTSYWYDGDKVIGYRLYKEVRIQSRTWFKDKKVLAMPSTNIQWETMATNLEEFREIADKLSSSKVATEVAVSKPIETDVIPVLEKLQKNKERALKRKHRQRMLLHSFQSSCVTGITRSCRSRKTVSYTFDDYDRAITEAIQVTNKRKTAEERKQDQKHRESIKSKDTSSNGDLNTKRDLEDISSEKDDRIDSDSDMLQEVDINDNDDVNNDGKSDDDYDEKNGDDDNDDISDSSKSEEETDKVGNNKNVKVHSQNQTGNFGGKPASIYRRQQTGDARDHVVKTRVPGLKNGVRQRPSHNSTFDSVVVLDSGNEKLSENSDSETAAQGDCC